MKDDILFMQPDHNLTLATIQFHCYVPSVPGIKVEQYSLFFRQVGKLRPPLLFLHGAGGSSLHFMPLLTLVGKHHHVVALDLPAHGKSSEGGLSFSPASLLDEYREAVAVFAEKIGLGKFILIGHSMGGAIALEFSRAYPDRLAGLVLIASAARFVISDEIMDLFGAPNDVSSSALAALGYSTSNTAAQALHWAKGQFQAPPAVVAADLKACRFYDVRHNIPRVNCHALIISGADDRLTPLAQQAQLAELIPHSQWEVISRAGHFLLWERPEAIAEVMLGSNVLKNCRQVF